MNTNKDITKMYYREMLMFRSFFLYHMNTFNMLSLGKDEYLNLPIQKLIVSFKCFL